MIQHEDFLVELGTEELPPLALETLAIAFHDNLINEINDAGLEFDSSEFYATPRRLAVFVKNLATAQQDKIVERQGPAVQAAFNDKGEATPAALGFARSCGVNVEDLSEVDTPKGKKLAFNISEKGQNADKLLPEQVKKALSRLPIPKAMRWGNESFSFIRPVKWLVMLQGEKVIPANLFNCESSKLSRGHRFLSEGAVQINTPSEYLETLLNHKVVACLEKRKNMIKEQVDDIATSLDATAVIDPTLLSEVTALVEWPVALAGNFDEEFLSVPQEALISTMAKNQKYFHLNDKNGKLISKFITISNINSHKPETIISGNERVIRPRLADAKFFFDQDSKHSLTLRAEKLKSIIFQKDLGTVFDKTLRIQKIAEGICKTLSIESSDISHAAKLCKSDLVTEMVGEFPSLQGIMGRYYAAIDGETEEVSAAMDEIYMPRFAGDQLPETQTGMILALADRLDTLCGIFAIGQIPTGNKDPFALRRASLGILRIIIEKELDLDLSALVDLAFDNLSQLEIKPDCKTNILDFFNARLRSMYLEQGYSAEQLQSVLVLSGNKPLDAVLRFKAVQEFDQLPDSQFLAEANKRVANILAKNADEATDQQINSELLLEEAEQLLVEKVNNLSPEIASLCKQSQYNKALINLADLKGEIDQFFDTVMVMAEDDNLRKNRLAILTQLRNLFIAIADISCLQK